MSGCERNLPYFPVRGMNRVIFEGVIESAMIIPAIFAVAVKVMLPDHTYLTGLVNAGYGYRP
jgi:hypothetical protein